MASTLTYTEVTIDRIEDGLSCIALNLCIALTDAVMHRLNDGTMLTCVGCASMHLSQATACIEIYSTVVKSHVMRAFIIRGVNKLDVAIVS